MLVYKDRMAFMMMSGIPLADRIFKHSSSVDGVKRILKINEGENCWNIFGLDFFDNSS